MCGIAGVFHYKNEKRISKNEIISVRDSMFTRGPDFGGVLIDEVNHFAFAHRRLSIIDLNEEANQPMISSNDEYSIVFNGEIYNYIELRNDLQKKGFIFKTNSDTEVILKLYQLEKENVVNSLRGMFAFAIFDKKNKTLFLARDHFGIKPLYYSFINGSFYFSSQVKSLLKFGEIKKEFSEAAEVGFYLWGHVPEPFTMLKNCFALPSGAYMVVKKSGFQIQKYFSINDTVIKLTQKKPKEKFVSVIHDSFSDSIEKHFISDVPVSLFLSSGIDSSVITAFASQIKNNLTTLTLGFEEFKGTENDETNLAKKTSEYYGTNHHTHWLAKNEFLDDFSNIIEKMDQPSVDGFNTYFVSKLATTKGFKVALSGLGADELFAGYNSFNEISELVRFLGYSSFFPKKFGHILRKMLYPDFSKIINPKLAGLFEYGSTYEEAYLLRRSLYMPYEISKFLDYEFFVKGWEELNPIQQMKKSVKNINDPKLAIHILQTDFYMKNQLLRDSDWASMAHSLELRVPFVDIELYKKIIPFFLKLSMNKTYLAKSPSVPLPVEIVNRKKTGFSIPTAKWIADKFDIKGNSLKDIAGFILNEYKKSL